MDTKDKLKDLDQAALEEAMDEYEKTLDFVVPEGAKVRFTMSYDDDMWDDVDSAEAFDEYEEDEEKDYDPDFETWDL